MTPGPWGADRIDHGVRAIEDPELVALLVDRRVPLGVCPRSALELGVYAAIDASFADADVKATLLKALARW